MIGGALGRKAQWQLRCEDILKLLQKTLASKRNGRLGCGELRSRLDLPAVYGFHSGLLSEAFHRNAFRECQGGRTSIGMAKDTALMVGVVKVWLKGGSDCSWGASGGGTGDA